MRAFRPGVPGRRYGQLEVMDHTDMPPVTGCPGQLPLFPVEVRSANSSVGQPDGHPLAAEDDRLQEVAARGAAVQPYLT